MNGSMRINADTRVVGIGWLVLAVATAGLVVGIALGTAASSAVKLPPVGPDTSDVTFERNAVTHGIYPAAAVAVPTCAGSGVIDEAQAVRRGIHQPGLAAIQFCAEQAEIARELDAIRHVRSAAPGAFDGPWTDWNNFHHKP